MKSTNFLYTKPSSSLPLILAWRFSSTCGIERPNSALWIILQKVIQQHGRLIPSFRTLLAAKGPNFRFQDSCCGYKWGSDVAHRSDFLMGRHSNPWQASYRKIKLLGRMKTNTWNWCRRWVNICRKGFLTRDWTNPLQINRYVPRVVQHQFPRNLWHKAFILYMSSFD